MQPKLGEIWKHTSKDIHYLILKEDDSLNYDYTFLIMESGKQDRAHYNHFVKFCIKVA